jgi:hypothetical protein
MFQDNVQWYRFSSLTEEAEGVGMQNNRGQMLFCSSVDPMHDSRLSGLRHT